MKKKMASALSAVALMWLGSAAVAQQPASTPAPVWHAPSCQLNDGCNDCGGGFYGSASILWLRPRWENNLAFTATSTIVDGANQFVNVTPTQFDYDARINPRIVLGYSSCDGIGARVRWFQGWWSDSKAAVDPIGPQNNPALSIASATPLGLQMTSFGSPDAPASVTSASNLRLQVWDFEATKNTKIGGLDITAAGGVRLLHMSQHYDMFISTPGGAVFTDQALISDHSHNLVGPTAALEGRLPLGGGLALFASGRVSLLFGDHRQSAIALQFAPDLGFGTPLNFAGAAMTRDGLMPVTELEIGGEWSTPMGNSELFVQGGFIGQVYYGAGNSSRAGNFANESNSNLGLIGFSLNVGVRF